jgi:hypothetical protein
MSYDFIMFMFDPNADLHETLSVRERAKGPHLQDCRFKWEDKPE